MLPPHSFGTLLNSYQVGSQREPRCNCLLSPEQQHQARGHHQQVPRLVSPSSQIETDRRLLSLSSGFSAPLAKPKSRALRATSTSSRPSVPTTFRPLPTRSRTQTLSPSSLRMSTPNATTSSRSSNPPNTWRKSVFASRTRLSARVKS